MIRSYRRIETSNLLKIVVGTLLFLLLLGIGLVYIFPSMASINRLTGIAFIVCSLPLIGRSFTFPLEAVLYGAFILWSLASGLIVAQSRSLVLDYAQLLAQLLVLFLIVINLGKAHKYSTISLLILLAIGVIVILNSLTGPQSIDILFGDVFKRDSSFMANPNQLGVVMCLGIVTALFYWGKANRVKRLFLTGLISLFMIGIVISGSRKAFLAILILLLFWLLFCYWKNIFQRPALIFLIVAVLLGAWFFVDYILNNTYLGMRLLILFTDPDQSTRRISLYQQAIDIFLSHPVAGVGLNNFQLYTITGHYAHSDIGEILADTGAVGAILYFPIYLVIWLRLNRLGKNIRLAEKYYSLGVFKAAILTILFFGTGQPNFTNIFIMFFLAIIVGYTLELEKEMAVKKASG